MIVAAIAQCEKTKDVFCVGEGYRVYGLFFQSASVTQFGGHYQKHGFLDQSATWDTRYQASIGYFRKAAALAKNADHSDVLSSIHYDIGKDFALLHESESACVEFSQALQAHEEFQRQNPGATDVLVKERGSFGATVADLQRMEGCPGLSAPVRNRAETIKSIVLNVTGSADVMSAKDWHDFKEVWRDACLQEAAAFGVPFSMRESLPDPTRESGTLVVVDVADYRYVSAGSRKMFGAMTGNAFVNAQAAFHDIGSGGVWSNRTFDTSSSAWQGVAAPMTAQQVRWICRQIIGWITW